MGGGSIFQIYVLTLLNIYHSIIKSADSLRFEVNDRPKRELKF